MNDELHVLFGAGQVGNYLARILLKANKRVRIAKRSPKGVPEGVEVIQGDAGDREFCIKAAEGATTVYHCMNPPYYAHIWAELVPKYMENLIAAAGSAGAKLVVLDNVYMLGKPNGKPLDEDSPLNPCSKKGTIRARAAERLFEAHKKGEVIATTGRASDFYGPGGKLTFLGDYFWKPVVAGKTARVFVNPDTIHTYHYIPDVAKGLMTLGCAEKDVYGKPWMLPCPPVETMRVLVNRFSKFNGEEIKLGRIPKWIMKLTGVFVPLVKELNEMSYQWDEPFIINDKRFRERFKQEPTDVNEAAKATVEWAKEYYNDK